MNRCERQRDIPYRAIDSRKSQDQLQSCCLHNHSFFDSSHYNLCVFTKSIKRNISSFIRNCYTFLSFLGTTYDEENASKRTTRRTHGRAGILREGREASTTREAITNIRSKPSPTATGTVKGQRGRDKGMNIYVITYDQPGILRNSDQLLNAIRGLGPHSIRPMERTWMIGTDLTPDAIQQHLQPFLNQPFDRLLINQLTYYQGWLPQDTWDWVNQVSREF